MLHRKRGNQPYLRTRDGKLRLMCKGVLDRSKHKLTITLKGDILSTNAEEFSGNINRLLKKHKLAGWDELKLDLNSARIIDSMGLNMILNIVKQVQAAGKSMKIHISSSAIQRVFQFSRLDQAVEIAFKKRRRR